MAGQTRARIIAVLWASGIIAASAPAWADEQSTNDADAAPAYELGHGLRLGNSGFTLGGYASVEYQDRKNEDPRFSFSNLSLFLWWEGASRWKFFSELDSEDTLATRYHLAAGERRYLSLERFYFDYAFNDFLSVRTGKFLTPIGRWNLLHAAPLVWTTSRPMITQDLFPDNATGLQAMGSVLLADKQVDYTLYTSLIHDPHRDPAQNPFSEAYGAHVNVAVSENTQIGMSLTRFSQTSEQEERRQLLGGDFLWAYQGYELSAEFAYVASSKGGPRAQKGMFVQGVAPLYGNLYGVGRYELFRSEDAPQAIRRWVVGLTYRTRQSTSFKLEYIRSMHDDYASPAGLLSSVSVLF